MHYSQRDSRLFVAIDESNHGRDEEIFVAAFSNTPEFARYIKFTANQDQRREMAAKMRICPQLNYLFCVVNREHYDLFGEHNVQKEVSRAFFDSLLCRGFEIDAADIYIDGDFKSYQREETREAVRKILNHEREARDKIPYPAVLVHASPKSIDRGGRVKANALLLLADFQSNKLFNASRYSTTDKRGRYACKRVAFPLHK